ncbi:unnamed protein product [Sphagnum troendelagicum]|uniref:Uncharacterized protein n=1 Tax=Sphagnum troendelagicum TaxID=128251 RepID=A0ABP0TDJ2_9BRYO
MSSVYMYMPAHGLCLPSISGLVSRRSCRCTRAPPLSLFPRFAAAHCRRKQRFSLKALRYVCASGSTKVQGLWMYPLTRFFLSQFLMQLL